jgi:hypothetical protein
VDIPTLIGLFAGGGVVTTGTVVIIYFMWRHTYGAAATANLVRAESVAWLLILGYLAFSYVEHQAQQYVILDKKMFDPPQKPIDKTQEQPTMSTPTPTK